MERAFQSDLLIFEQALIFLAEGFLNWYLSSKQFQYGNRQKCQYGNRLDVIGKLCMWWNRRL